MNRPGVAVRICKIADGKHILPEFLELNHISTLLLAFLFLAGLALAFNQRYPKG